MLRTEVGTTVQEPGKAREVKGGSRAPPATLDSRLHLAESHAISQSGSRASQRSNTEHWGMVTISPESVCLGSVSPLREGMSEEPQAVLPSFNKSVWEEALPLVCLLAAHGGGHPRLRHQATLCGAPQFPSSCMLCDRAHCWTRCDVSAPTTDSAVHPGCDVTVARACGSLATSRGAVKKPPLNISVVKPFGCLCSMVPLYHLPSLNGGNFPKIH